MSVYKPAKSRIWLYDFTYKGQRFHGSTGQTSRRNAETVERQRRVEAATGTLGQVATMTLDQAAGRWWTEKGITRKDAADVERRIAVLLDLIGKDTLLANIDQEAVARAIEARRLQPHVRSKRKGAKAYLPSNSTVNRDVIETLRPILKRAKTHWAKRGPHGLPEIDWRELRLSEPRGLTRMYSDDERAAWIAACPEEASLALELLLTYGLRFGELFFHPDQFAADADRPALVLQKGRKRDVLLHVPLRRDHARLLAARVARAKAAGLGHVWYLEGRKGLVEMTRHQMEGRLSRAADAAGVAGGRRIHGARHHAASAILRKTRSPKHAQSLLGHASLQSTQRYLHVLDDELRAALEDDVSRQYPEPAISDDDETKAG